MAKKLKLSHLDDKGRAHMVDIGAKAVTAREAVAEALLTMQPATLKLIKSGKSKKGDVLAVARIAGIQAAKRTPEWIPLCHQIPLESIKVSFEPVSAKKLRVTAAIRCSAKTGAEMEALCAVSAAALTVYDMLKAVDRGMRIDGVRVLKKSGGKSGTYLA